MDKDNILPSKAAEALAFLDWMCIDMGDSHVEQVRELCDLAKTKFPEDADDIGTEVLIKFATEAYKECLKEKATDTLSTNLSYYESCIDFIMQQIAYIKDAEKSIGHMKVLLKFIQENATDELSATLVTAKRLANLLSSMDVPLVRVGHYVGERLWKQLDHNRYFQSNTGFAVGHVTQEDDAAHALGDYVCYADPLQGDDGYAVIFRRKDGKCIAHVYAYEHGTSFSEYRYSDEGYELVISDNDIPIQEFLYADKKRVIRKLAAYINSLPTKNRRNNHE